MKKIVFTLAITILSILSGNAQTTKSLISVGNNSGFNIKAGTTVSANQLEVIPTNDFSVTTSLTYTEKTTKTIGTDFNNIVSGYSFNAPTNAYTGVIGFLYKNVGLNNNAESSLKLLYKKGVKWFVDKSSNNNLTSKKVTTTFTNNSLSELTLGNCLPKTGTDSITACTSYKWIDGITYTASNYTAKFTVLASSGCDSIVTLKLTIQPIGTLTLFSAGGSNAQVKCNQTAITPIVYTTSTGTTNAKATGLPAGVTGVWAAGKFTISGTPTETGVFNYTVTAVGTCATAMGKLTVNQNTIKLTSVVNSDKQTFCVNTASTPITYGTVGATGAKITNLPSGVTGYFGPALNTPEGKNQVNISGVPSVSGTYNYTVTLTGGCGVTTATGVYVVNPKNTIVLTSLAATATQTKCIKTAITDIIYTTTTATGTTVSGLPAGVTGAWAANKFTITGTPTVAGIFNYTVTTVGGCSVATATGTINSTINAIALSSALGTDAQTKCIGTAITPITYTTSIATGATVTGLPAGVSGVWGANKLTISGTPTVAGPFTYTITLTGGCEVITKTGTLVVSPNNTVTLSSGLNSNVKEVCVGATLAPITYTTTGVTGVTFTGLPAGVKAIWAANTITISGIPTAAGVYPYTVTATGGCSVVLVKGTITVNAINTIALTSAAGTDKQTICTNGAIINIGYKTTGATAVTVANLPAGLAQSASAGVVTISGKPTATGTYTITASGKCPSVVASGTITIAPLNTITIAPLNTNVKEVCVNAVLSDITYNSTGATGATFAGLPAGVTGKLVSNVITLAGKPTTKGIYAYTVTGTGGCPGLTAKGTITVNELNAITLTSAPATTNQIVCTGSPITQIGYKITGTSSVQVSTLPGLSQTNSAGVITISGTPTASVNYSITANGKCPSVTVLGKITVNPANTITLEPTSASNVQNICAKSAIGNILYKTTGATNATFTGLPLGVKGTWVNNLVTLSGNPYVAGTSNYTVTLTGGCKVVTATGSIKVGAENKLSLTSAATTISQTVKAGVPIAPITYTTLGATTVNVTNLPAGVSSAWGANKLTISGTPTISGTKIYNVELLSVCPRVIGTGTINVTTGSGAGTALRPVSESNIEVTSYPNPFSTAFKMNVVSQSEEPIAVQITDMVGRIVENHVINSYELSEKEIGEAYPVGVYNIVLTQGSETTTFRIVKQ
jgi:hypothetical protein